MRFYSPITLIQSGQTHKQTHKHTNTQQSSFNNIDIYWNTLVLFELKHYIRLNLRVKYDFN